MIFDTKFIDFDANRYHDPAAATLVRPAEFDQRDATHVRPRVNLNSRPTHDLQNPSFVMQIS